MNDYERVASLIRYLVEHQAEQPALSALGTAAGLSPFHLHRLFSTWAGVTPKDFLQCLTLSRARALLRHGHSVLSAALQSGLSGPGRLHDLCVSLEAASPGELKEGGSGWTLVFGFAETPFGHCLIGESLRGICHVAFVEPKEGDAAMADLKNAWPRARYKRSDSAAAQVAATIFRERLETERPALRAFVKGTAFQVRVWRALLQIPPGTLTTYGRLAEAIGKQGAARAVGSAVAQNPLAYLIPCHRVIRETGVIGDYRWNPIRKRAMLGWEMARTTLSPDG